MLATNSIRGGANREVLNRIVRSTRIFEAWSDEPWVNNGAAVRVSLVGFGSGAADIRLNGVAAGSINVDLTSMGAVNESDLTSAARPAENRATAYQG